MPNYSKLLGSAAKGVGKGLLSGAGKVVVNVILTEMGIGEGVQLDEMQAEIHQISQKMDSLAQDVKAVHASIENLGGQLADMWLDLKSTDLEDLMSDMGSTYMQITKIVMILARPETAKPADQLTKEEKNKIHNDRLRLTELLTAARDSFPKSLGRLHRALSKTDDGSVLQMAALKANDSDPDIFTYYLRMAAFVAPFWFAQMQAISILETVVQHPEIRFGEGPDMIQSYHENLENQQEAFRTVVGWGLCGIVEALVHPSEPTSAPSVAIRLTSTEWRHVVLNDQYETAPGINGRNLEFIVKNNRDAPSMRFRLYPKFDCNPAKIQLSERHRFQLFLDDGSRQGRLSFRDTPFGLQNSNASAGKLAIFDHNVKVGDLDSGASDLCIIWKKRAGSFFKFQLPDDNKTELVLQDPNTLDYGTPKLMQNCLSEPKGKQWLATYLLTTRSPDDPDFERWLKPVQQLVLSIMTCGFDPQKRLLFMRSEGHSNSDDGKWWLDAIE